MRISYRVPNATYDASGGFWTYPCAQPVKASISFSGLDKPFLINETDLNFGRVNALSERCVGAIIEGNTAGYWVLGLSFLKNYYSVSSVHLLRAISIFSSFGTPAVTDIRCWKLPNWFRFSCLLNIPTSRISLHFTFLISVKYRDTLAGPTDSLVHCGQHLLYRLATETPRVILYFVGKPQVQEEVPLYHSFYIFASLQARRAIEAFYCYATQSQCPIGSGVCPRHSSRRARSHVANARSFIMAWYQANAGCQAFQIHSPFLDPYFATHRSRSCICRKNCFARYRK